MDDVKNVKLADIHTAAPFGTNPVLQITDSKNITIVAPDIMPSDHPLIQLKATDIEELTIKRYKKFDGWLINIYGCCQTTR